MSNSDEYVTFEKQMEPSLSYEGFRNEIVEHHVPEDKAHNIMDRAARVLPEPESFIASATKGMAEPKPYVFDPRNDPHFMHEVRKHALSAAFKFAPSTYEDAMVVADKMVEWLIQDFTRPDPTGRPADAADATAEADSEASERT